MNVVHLKNPRAIAEFQTLSFDDFNWEQEWLDMIGARKKIVYRLDDLTEMPSDIQAALRKAGYVAYVFDENEAVRYLSPTIVL